MFEELSEEYGTGYVSNVLDGLVGNTEYMDDAIHPNDAGHALIAERIYEEMAQLGYVSVP
jgi:lysophospholipase L1-like esterase